MYATFEGRSAFSMKNPRLVDNQTEKNVHDHVQFNLTGNINQFRLVCPRIQELRHRRNRRTEKCIENYVDE